MICKIFLIGCFLLVSSEASAQGWRELAPLRSNCDDLKRMLGITRCANGTYDFTDAKVTITFSDGTCATGWNVVADTILTIEVHPKTPVKLKDLHLNEAMYEKTVDTHLTDVTHFRNKDEGVTVAVFSSGIVANISYEPSVKDNALECPGKPEPVRPPRASLKFDEYESLKANQEERRLDNFATQLLAEPNQDGYVIAYGRRGKLREAQERGARVKAYLVSRGVAKDRITVVEGGYRDQWMIQVFVVFK